MKKKASEKQFTAEKSAAGSTKKGAKKVKKKIE